MAVFTGNGSAASPSITFSSDTDTGIFRAGENALTIATGGNPQLRVSSDQVLIGQEFIPSGSGPAGNSNAQVTAGLGSLTLYRSDNTNTGVGLTLGKNRGTSPSNLSPVLNGDAVGAIHFIGSDGTTGGSEVVTLTAQCLRDVVPGSGVVKGRLRLFVRDFDGDMFETLTSKTEAGGFTITTNNADPISIASYEGQGEEDSRPNWTQSSANGTRLAPTKTLTGERLLGILARGHTGTEFATGVTSFYSASIEFRAQEDGDQGNGTNIWFRTAPTGVNSSRTTRMVVRHDGKVGIGVVAPTNQLQLSTDSAGKPGTNTWTITSDARIKDNIEDADLTTCLEIVKNIPLKRFKWKDEVYSSEMVEDRHKLGWIAQDVQPVFPKAVKEKEFRYGQVYETIPGKDPVYNEDGEILEEGTEGQTVLVSEQVISDCLDLNSDQIYAAMFGAVQKLIEKVEDLEYQVSQLGS
jgi:hypothetical protein